MLRLKLFYLCISLVICGWIQVASSIPTYDELFQSALADETYTVETRRYLHQYPEIRLEEYETSKFIQKELTEMGVSFTSGWGINTANANLGKGGTGVVAQIGTGKPPCIGLRADFDALPIHELVDVPFKSKIDGMMHACGHDAHTAMLLGAARQFKKYESQLEGTVKLFFQPGEEGGAGAKFMVDEGCLTQYPPVERMYGFHVMSISPTGQVETSYGSSHAAADSFTLKVKGKGGSASNHHLIIDPLPAALAIIRSLYDLYAREMYFQIDTAGLISITIVKSGFGASNVIPDETIIGGTIRAPRTKNLVYMQNRLLTIATDVADAYRCTIEIQRQRAVTYPAVENDEKLIDWSKKIFADSFPGGVQTVPGNMGSEDFSFFAEKVPSVFFSIGSGSGGDIEGHVPTNVDHHNARFAVDERVLPQGVAMHCHLAFQSFEDMKSAPQKSEEVPKDEL